MLSSTSSADSLAVSHPVVKGTMHRPPHAMQHAVQKGTADYRWSWLPWSTRRPAWCAPWMLHQGSEPALERAASRRLSAQGERFRRCISLQSQGPARGIFQMAQRLVCLHKSVRGLGSTVVTVQLHSPELC